MAGTIFDELFGPGETAMTTTATAKRHAAAKRPASRRMTPAQVDAELQRVLRDADPKLKKFFELAGKLRHVL